MKKWEKPEIQVLSLEKTEASNVEEVMCLRCNITVFSDSNVEQVICYRCKCCGKEFHSNEDWSQWGGAQQAATAHASTCSQCS